MTAVAPAGVRSGFDPVDRITALYLAGCAAVIVVGWRGVPAPAIRLPAYLAVLGAIYAIARLPRPASGGLRFLREGYTLLLCGAHYMETQFLSRAFGGGYHDALVASWDQRVFGRHWNLELAARFPSPFLSEYLHACYLAYEALVPILGLSLYVSGRRAEFRVFATTLLTTFIACYACYVVFPVRGPWYEMAHPSVAGPFASAVSWMLERGAAVGAAFPSSHVAVAVAVLVVSFRHARRLFWPLLLVAGAIPLATVYGGFHYAIDALVGFFVGLAGGLLGPRLHRALSPGRAT